MSKLPLDVQQAIKRQAPRLLKKDFKRLVEKDFRKLQQSDLNETAFLKQ